MPINNLLLIIFTFTMMIVNGSSFSLSIQQEKESTIKDPLLEGKDAHVYTLQNDHGMTVKITNYRGFVMNIIVPNKNNEPTDVVLGYDSLKQYFFDKPFFGPIVGRYANRIAKGQFHLNGKLYQLPENDRGNSLHSGPYGFNSAIWDSEMKTINDRVELILTYSSPSVTENLIQSQGFPGNLHTTVTYSLNNKNQLSIDYSAKSDADTFVNLTNHTYFNLNGEGNGTILKHELYLNADQITLTNDQQIPTGKYGEVKDKEWAPFDFRKAKPIGQDINDTANPQIEIAHGYDQNFVLNKDKAASNGLVLAAEVQSPQTGIQLKVWTTEPGIQFYSGNSLNNTIIGKKGHVYDARTGFALETQHYPDSPNQKDFPSTLLKEGETYHQKTLFEFGIVR